MPGEHAGCQVNELNEASGAGGCGTGERRCFARLQQCEEAKFGPLRTVGHSGDDDAGLRLVRGNTRDDIPEAFIQAGEAPSRNTAGTGASGLSIPRIDSSRIGISRIKTPRVNDGEVPPGEYRAIR